MSTADGPPLTDNSRLRAARPVSIRRHLQRLIELAYTLNIGINSMTMISAD